MMDRFSHQRGLGQVAPVCQGGAAPLGYALRWGEVDCPQCRLAVVVDRYLDALRLAFEQIVDFYRPVVAAVVDALRPGVAAVGTVLDTLARAAETIPDGYTLADDGADP